MTLLLSLLLLLLSSSPSNCQIVQMPLYGWMEGCGGGMGESGFLMGGCVVAVCSREGKLKQLGSTTLEPTNIVVNRVSGR